MSTQKMYEAKIIPAVGGAPLMVNITANDQVQAKKLIEQQYGPIKSWLVSPRPAK